MVLRELENTLATKLQEFLWPEFPIQSVCDSKEILNAVKSIFKMALPDWPEELLFVLAQAKSALAGPFPVNMKYQHASTDYSGSSARAG
jgi:hypothetical protein